MHELELWSCSCGAERTYGFSNRGPKLGKASAVIHCAHCQRLTLHTFSGKHREAVPQFFALTNDYRDAGQPAQFWKKAPKSAHSGISPGRLGYRWAMERH